MRTCYEALRTTIVSENGVVVVDGSLARGRRRRMVGVGYALCCCTPDEQSVCLKNRVVILAVGRGDPGQQVCVVQVATWVVVQCCSLESLQKAGTWVG